MLEFRKFKQISKEIYETEQNCGTIIDFLLAVLQKLLSSFFIVASHLVI